MSTSPPGSRTRADVRIRAAEPEDAPRYAAMLAEASIIAGTLRLPFTSQAAARTHFAERLEADGSFLLTAQAQSSGEYAGHAALELARSPRRRHVGTVVLLVPERYQRRGVGSALMTGLLDLADNWCQLHRVELEVNVDNLPAIALYERLGFVVEATKRGDCFRDGAYIDAHVMGRIRP